MLDLKLDVLYRFEHQILPARFYFQKDRFIQEVLERDGLFNMLDAAYRKEGKKNPYKKEQFRTVSGEAEGLMLVVLHLPHEEGPLFCDRILMIWEPDYTKMAYYTVENGESERWLGKWDCEVRFHYSDVTDFLDGSAEKERKTVIENFKKEAVCYE